MSRVILFAGTTEGAELAAFLSGQGIETLALVATGYGKRSLPERPHLRVSAGRLDAAQMEELFREMAPDLILDATHPYAGEVSANIRSASEAVGLPLWRILRPDCDEEGGLVNVSDAAEAAAYLKTTKGNILLTTGSKELGVFAGELDLRERLYARVLSLPEVLKACRSLGIEGRHLIGMQGPFSALLNEAMLKEFDCRYLVTKRSGRQGGFEEKLEAAKKLGVQVVCIGRPLKEEGLTLAEAKKALASRYGLKPEKKVSLVGIGMGSREGMTLEAVRTLSEAELIIGAARIAEAAAGPGKRVLHEYRPEKITEEILACQEEKIAAVFSGDTGFYSGASALTACLRREQIPYELICGVSSVSAFFARAALSWEDALLCSRHGRQENLCAAIRDHEKVFSILGEKGAVGELAKELTELGLGEVLLHVGENLSYPGEKVFSEKAKALTGYEGSALSVVIAENRAARPLFATHGLPDEAFIRGKVPMTKEEVRSVSLSKLRLYADSICWDVGAGTGSVSVEMALRCPKGKVFAVETKEEALELIRRNRLRYACANLEPVPGFAPEALKALPAPDRVFIGGSKGQLSKIVDLVLSKNPDARIVINCITLDTLSEALQLIRRGKLSGHEIVQLQVSRSRQLAGYEMMAGENPVSIVTLQGGSRADE